MLLTNVVHLEHRFCSRMLFSWKFDMFTNVIQLEHRCCSLKLLTWTPYSVHKCRSLKTQILFSNDVHLMIFTCNTVAVHLMILNLNVELHPISLNTELICNGLLKVTLWITLILFTEVHIIGLLKHWKSKLTRDCMNSPVCMAHFPPTYEVTLPMQGRSQKTLDYKLWISAAISPSRLLRDQ